MKQWILIGAVALTACSAAGGRLPEGAVEVSENAVNNFVSPAGAKYDMRTYRAPSDDYFYITVTPSGRSLTFQDEGRRAGAAASAYIQPRSCTGNLSRLTSRDVYDSASKTWTIVIAC